MNDYLQLWQIKIFCKHFDFLSQHLSNFTVFMLKKVPKFSDFNFQISNFKDFKFSDFSDFS